MYYLKRSQKNSQQKSANSKEWKKAEKDYFQKKIQLDRQLLNLEKQKHLDLREFQQKRLELDQINLELQTQLSSKRFQILQQFQRENVSQKWQEIQLNWDSKQNWFSKINRVETEAILTKYAHCLLILTSPPQIAIDSELDSFRNLDFELQMRHVDDFLEQNYPSAGDGVYHPVKHYSDYFKEPINKLNIEQLHSLLNKIPVYIIYPDITVERISFRIAFWTINGELQYLPQPIEWNWQQTLQQMLTQGKSEAQSIAEIRNLFVESYKVITALLSDYYYLSIDPLYRVRFNSLNNQLAIELPIELTTQFHKLEGNEQKQYLHNLEKTMEENMDNIQQDQIFNDKRKELLILLDTAEEKTDKIAETKEFNSISRDITQQIHRTRQRCIEGLFDIVLIAAFQSGKSTTFNTFADGHEIAPRGLGGGGVKTSACLIKVQNCHQNEQEIVKVNWRSETDLLLRVDEALGETACLISNSSTAKKLREINQKKAQAKTEKEAEKYDQQYYSIISFKTSEGQALLEQALIKELEEYQKSEEKGSENVQDKLDRLRFAMIVLAYHNSPILNNLRTRDTFNPKEIDKYLKFPPNFDQRWNKCFKNLSHNLTKQEFQLEEVMYPFIQEVIYKINSENLKKSGAQIIDCPGLFASRYDTYTAIEAMQNASAIWFLISGYKQLSISEIKALDMIKQSGHQKKVFFGINYKQNPNSKASKNVINTIVEQIKELGFTASYQLEPLYFNAFLALRAMQGEKLLRNNLDLHTEKQIILDAEAMLEDDDEFENNNNQFDSASEAWSESVKEVIAQVGGVKKLKNLSPSIDSKTVQFVRGESQWDLATEKIKEFVFKTKAWSMLVDLGCEPVIQTIKKAEDSLKIAEENAHKTLDKSQLEWDEARGKLALFKEESEKVLEFYLDENWEIVLAKNFWEQVYLPSIEETGALAAPIIADEANIQNAVIDIFPQIGNNIIGGWNWVVEKIGFNNLKSDTKFEPLKERCAKIIRTQFEYSLQIKSGGWFNSLKKGGNKDYENLILKRVLKVCNLLEKNWDNLKLDHNEYLSGLDVNLPKFSGDIRKDMEKYNQDGLEGAVDKSIAKPFEDMAVFFTASYFLFLFDLAFPGLGAVLFTVAVLAVVIASRFKGREQYIKDISDKITEELTKGVGPKQHEITQSLQEKLIIVRNFYSGKIQESFDKISQDLEKRIKDAQKTLSLSQAERERIAQLANNFRTNELEPLQKQLQAFLSSVEQIWQKPS